jgi:hypothetical protein
VSWSDIKEWQTLIAALVALVAAWLTVQGARKLTTQQIAAHRDEVSRQIKAQRDEAQARRQREFGAALAVLPGDLAEISHYLRDCAGAAGDALRMVRGDIEKKPVDIPQLPYRVIENLRLLIASLEAADAAAVAELLRCYQIQYSRLSSELKAFNRPERLGPRRVMTPQQLERTFEKTFELQMLVDNMLYFAREKTDHVPARHFTPDSLLSAIFQLDVYDLLSQEHRQDLLSKLGTDQG